MNIIIIGMRGAGKSNVSRRLAVLTKRPPLSTDMMIEYENGGRSIPEIIKAHDGDWRYFRDTEFETIQKLCKMDGLIIDCGGGVIVDLDENGEETFSDRKVGALKKTGKIIWLKGGRRPPCEQDEGRRKTPLSFASAFRRRNNEKTASVL